jgi:hypothetical protein
MMSKNKRAYTALGVVLAAVASVALAGTFNLFSPATGILKGSSGTYVTTAANSTDVRGLWTGTCNSSSFLRGDGACAAAGSGTVTSVALTMPTGFSVGGSPITGSGTLAVTSSLSGVLKGSGGAFTTSTVSDIIALFSGLCNPSHFLRGDGVCSTIGGVTSVDMTVPSWLTVSGNPITSSGTLAVTATTGQTANQFLATPNGSTGAVGLRAIVDADLSSNVALLNGGQNFSVAPTITSKNVCLADGTNCPAASDTSGTYTATLSTGCTTTPTVTAKWVKNGHLVTINFGNFGTCTSNSTLTSLDTSVPVAERPASNQCTQVISVEDNTVLSHATVRVLTTGAIDFGLDGASGGTCSGAGWTASGIKSLGAGYTITFQTAN